MRQMLPTAPNHIECGVINLGDITSNGTHWTCYVKLGDEKFYFDSFGDARPPLELVHYLGSDNICYNTEAVQCYDDPPICGHLCLEVLRRNDNGNDWNEIVRCLRDNKYVWKSWFNNR